MSDASGAGGRAKLEQRGKLCACLLDRSPDGVVITDQSDTILLANEAFCHLAGCRVDEIPGRGLAECLPGLDREGRQAWSELTASLRTG